MLINKCGSPNGEWEIHCNFKQKEKIRLMFEQEMNNTRTDACRDV